MIPDDNGIEISHAIGKLAPAIYRVALTEHNAPEVYKKLIQEGNFIQVISKFDSESILIRRLEVAYSSKKERHRKGL